MALLANSRDSFVCWLLLASEHMFTIIKHLQLSYLRLLWSILVSLLSRYGGAFVPWSFRLLKMEKMRPRVVKLWFMNLASVFWSNGAPSFVLEAFADWYLAEEWGLFVTAGFFSGPLLLGFLSADTDRSPPLATRSCLSDPAKSTIFSRLSKFLPSTSFYLILI